MWESVFNAALNNGLWAALFVALMIYVLRDTAKREKKYQDLHEENQDIIMQLVENLRVVNDIKKDISDIKGDLRIGKIAKQRRVVKHPVDSHIVGGAAVDQRGSEHSDTDRINGGIVCHTHNSGSNH